MNASRGASLSNTVPCSPRRRPAPYSAHAYFMQWLRACVSRRRYRGIARRDAQPVSSSVNNHTFTSRAAARKAMIAAHLGLTLDLPPPLLFTSLCTCRVLPGYGCRQQGLLSASVSTAVSPPPLTAYSRSARLRSYTGANLPLLCFCDLRGAWAAGVRERWFD